MTDHTPENKPELNEEYSEDAVLEEYSGIDEETISEEENRTETTESDPVEVKEAVPVRKRRKRKKASRPVPAIRLPQMTRKVKIGLIAAFVFLIYLVIGWIDHPVIEMNIENHARLEVQYGDHNGLPQVTATYHSNLFHKDPIDLKVKVKDKIKYEKFGTYTVTYSASYRSKRLKRKVRVKVVDTQAPVITLTSDNVHFTAPGYDYVEEGFTAVDNFDGDITSQVSRVEENGQVVYTVTDSNGNTASATRTIPYRDKLVYLTYDDGPGEYTDALLAVLDKYGVKATFFVTHQTPQYQSSIARAYEAGHSIGLHTYSHSFDTIYAGVDDFFNDLQRMSDIVEEETGYAPKFFRFAGGSGNSASRQVKPGIMTDLIREAPLRGYQYVDWNVSSSDANGKGETAEAIAENVIRGIQRFHLSVVLQHDTKGTCVEATERILKWGQENGYTFLPITETTYMYHGDTIRN